VDGQVFLDTDVAIDIIHGKPEVSKTFDLIDADRVFISVITLFELQLRRTNLFAVEIFRDKVEVIAFDEVAARQASIIWKELESKGKPIPFNDIFIAATCMTNNALLWTNNKKHYRKIRGLQLL
jgi:predicted nucleic acid-binding protein